MILSLKRIEYTMSIILKNRIVGKVPRIKKQVVNPRIEIFEGWVPSLAHDFEHFWNWCSLEHPTIKRVLPMPWNDLPRRINCLGVHFSYSDESITLMEPSNQKSLRNPFVIPFHKESSIKFERIKESWMKELTSSEIEKKYWLNLFLL